MSELIFRFDAQNQMVLFARVSTPCVVYFIVIFSLLSFPLFNQKSGKKIFNISDSSTKNSKQTNTTIDKRQSK